MSENLVVNGRAVVGNTSKRSPPLLYWAFTLNNPVGDDFERFERFLQKNACKWAMQEEIGEKEGTLHIQGAFTLKGKGKRFETLCREWKGCHFEVSRGPASITYCEKPTFEGAKRSIYPDKLMCSRPVNPIFDEIEALIKAPLEFRKIWWVHEETGGIGKSAFCRYMLITYGQNVNLISTSKSADILTAIRGNEKMIIFDFPRCSNVGTYCPFNALEQIKNGVVTDGKLKKEARQLIFNPPHVVCFANEEPDYSKLSLDRWVLRKL